MGHLQYSPDLAPNYFFISGTSRINCVDTDISKSRFGGISRGMEKMLFEECKNVKIVKENIFK